MAADATGAFAAIGAEAFERSVAFYEALLGRVPDERIGDGYAAFHLPGLRLGIFRPRATGVEEFRGAAGGLSLVMPVEDVEQAAAEIDRLGGTSSPPFDTPHGREAYAYDPDGNRLILVARG